MKILELVGRGAKETRMKRFGGRKVIADNDYDRDYSNEENTWKMMMMTKKSQCRRQRFDEII